MRRKSRTVSVGGLKLGGGNPILVQSMTNTDTKDVDKTVEQILELEKVGCDIVRLAVLDMEAAKKIGEIKKRVNIPLVADIHFNHKLALEAINQGVDKVRINPGNIGSVENVKKVVEAAKKKNVPIRIGVNIGSLDKEIEEKHGRTAKALAESALKEIKVLESLDFKDIIISIKASDVRRTVDACRILAKKCDYPLHLGVTEAGTYMAGTIKSSIGIGSLLLDGIGDTLRVSLTEDPTKEVLVGKKILKSLGLIEEGVEIISCPTCGRTQIDLFSLVEDIEKMTADIKEPLKLAVMGCVVNGPGEAKEADLGIAGGVGRGIIFRKGEMIKNVEESNLKDEFMKELEKMIGSGKL